MTLIDDARPQILIRNEEEKDYPAVHAVNSSAFPTSAEANLVDALRKHSHSPISLVAEINEEVVAHIMFTPVNLVGQFELKMVGLAPIAVAPAHQRKGYGSALIRAGIERCRKLGFGAVFVLGHSRYYERFNFLPAKLFGLTCEYALADDSFLVLELQERYFYGKSGTIDYHVAFKNFIP
jgi:putative acetyltransferase